MFDNLHISGNLYLDDTATSQPNRRPHFMYPGPCVFSPQKLRFTLRASIALSWAILVCKVFSALCFYETKPLKDYIHVARGWRKVHITHIIVIWNSSRWHLKDCRVLVIVPLILISVRMLCRPLSSSVTLFLLRACSAPPSVPVAYLSNKTINSTSLIWGQSYYLCCQVEIADKQGCSICSPFSK